MRVTRGLVASLGASGSITAAGAFGLLALSTIVGVRGWPGVSAVPVAPKTLVVAPAAAPRDQRAGRASVSPPARRVLAATEPAPRRSLGEPAAVRRVPRSAPRPAAMKPAPAAPRPAPQLAASAVPAPRPVPAPHPVADAVRGTGDTAGAAVTPVSPAAGETVREATDTVAGIVDGIPKP